MPVTHFIVECQECGHKFEEKALPESKLPQFANLQLDNDEEQWQILKCPKCSKRAVCVIGLYRKGSRDKYERLEMLK